jgi:TolB-like protein
MQRDLGRRHRPSPRHPGRTAAPPRRLPATAPDAATQTSKAFQLKLLGAFVLDARSRTSTLPKKGQALIAYLALHEGRPVPRERLAALLWGDNGEEQARRSLRQCLMSVRAAFKEAADDVLVTDAAGVRFAAGHHVAVDVADFIALSQSAEPDDLAAAAVLYRGDFLTGVSVVSEPFSEWVSAERRRIASAMSNLLFRLATAYAAAGDNAKAAAAAERLTAHDPLREDGHRILMHALARNGRRDAALKQYNACGDLLRRELGVGPDAATVALAETIRTGETDSASPVLAAKPALALPDKPSIAVLPFANLSADIDQDYFAEGMVEDIGITLGQVPWLFVIASSAAAGFKGRDADVRRAGAELGVRYVLRGSVRTSGKRVRIVVQLVEAAQGRHIWADRFDGDRDDVFAIQDRVTNQVSATIAPTLESVEIERIQRKPTDNPTAYELYLRALQCFRTDLAGNQAALRLLSHAIELDPAYSAAYGLAARCYHLQTVFGWARPSDPGMHEGFRLARIAADIGQNDSEALWMAGHNLAQVAGEVEYGLALIDRSLALNPNSASAWVSSCFVRVFLNDIDTALDHFARAQRLNPLDARHHIHWNAAARAYFAAGRLDEAGMAADRTLHERPTYPSALHMKVVIAGLRGQPEAGSPYLRRLLAVQPGFSVSWLKALLEPTRRYNPTTFARYVEGARLAGVPEGEPT